MSSTIKVRPAPGGCDGSLQAGPQWGQSKALGSYRRASAVRDRHREREGIAIEGPERAIERTRPRDPTGAPNKLNQSHDRQCKPSTRQTVSTGRAPDSSSRRNQRCQSAVDTLRPKREILLYRHVRRGSYVYEVPSAPFPVLGISYEVLIARTEYYCVWQRTAQERPSNFFLQSGRSR